MTGTDSIDVQCTLKSEVSVSGIGIFTGEKVSLTICPAPIHSGVVFQRIDLPGKPLIPAKLEFIREAPRCTRLGLEGISIYMVEHLLSALFGLGIDNALVQVEGSEIVVGDGSAQFFVDLIEKVGVQKQKAKRKVFVVKEPYSWSEGDVHMIALPAPEFRVSYTLHYPASSFLRSQYYSFVQSPEGFKKEIAPSRTFSIYEEILPLIEKGIIKGGGLENALVIKGDRVLNPDGVRFPDEMARHKILDLIGDLALVGAYILGHIISIRSGHASNVAFAKILKNQWERVS